MSQPTDLRWLVGAIAILCTIALTLTQCSQAKAVDDAYQRGRTEKHLEGLGSLISANAENLQSRAGQRWNKPDQEEFEQRLRAELAEMKAHVETMRGNRFTREDALRELSKLHDDIDLVARDLRDHLLLGGHPAALERLKAIEARVQEMRDEQTRRTDRVYTKAP